MPAAAIIHVVVAVVGVVGDLDRMRNLPRSSHCEKSYASQREDQPPEFNQSSARASTGSSDLFDCFKPKGCLGHPVELFACVMAAWLSMEDTPPIVLDRNMA